MTGERNSGGGQKGNVGLVTNDTLSPPPSIPFLSLATRHFTLDHQSPPLVLPSSHRFCFPFLHSSPLFSLTSPDSIATLNLFLLCDQLPGTFLSYPRLSLSLTLTSSSLLPTYAISHPFLILIHCYHTPVVLSSSLPLFHDFCL